MTMPFNGIISLNHGKSELKLSGPVSLGDTVIRNLFSRASGSISLSHGYGKSNVIPGNSGIITTSGSFVLPVTSGDKISILAIGGGGGGGGGTSRGGNYQYGPGGAGASSQVYKVLDITVTPGSVLALTVGIGGSPGGARDGPYSGGSAGGAGGASSVSYNSNIICLANGGGGGNVSQFDGTWATGGGIPGTGVGTLIHQAEAGTGGQSNGYYGFLPFGRDMTMYQYAPGVKTFGVPGIGYDSTGTVSGTRGVHGRGTADGQTWQNSSTGSGYGAGGGGGGCNASDNSSYFSGSPGRTGFIIVSWG